MTKKNEKRTKSLHVEIKATGDDGTFSGMGSVFGNVDSYGDVVTKGAFTKTLSERAGKIRCLWQHDSTKPIGVFTSLMETDEGLQVQGKLALDTQQGAEAWALLKMGAIDGMSIGFYTVKDTFDNTTGIRYINEVMLLEVSIVTFPANEEATVTNVKSAFEELNEEQRIKTLTFINKIKHATQSDDEPLVKEEVKTPVQHSEEEGAGKEITDEPQMDLHSLEQLSDALKQAITGALKNNKEVKNEHRT